MELDDLVRGPGSLPMVPNSPSSDSYLVRDSECDFEELSLGIVRATAEELDYTPNVNSLTPTECLTSSSLFAWSAFSPISASSNLASSSSSGSSSYSSPRSLSPASSLAQPLQFMPYPPGLTIPVSNPAPAWAMHKNIPYPPGLTIPTPSGRVLQRPNPVKLLEKKMFSLSSNVGVAPAHHHVTAPTSPHISSPDRDMRHNPITNKICSVTARGTLTNSPSALRTPLVSTTGDTSNHTAPIKRESKIRLWAGIGNRNTSTVRSLSVHTPISADMTRSDKTTLTVSRTHESHAAIASESWPSILSVTLLNQADTVTWAPPFSSHASSTSFSIYTTSTATFNTTATDCRSTSTGTTTSTTTTTTTTNASNVATDVIVSMKNNNTNTNGIKTQSAPGPAPRNMPKTLGKPGVVSAHARNEHTTLGNCNESTQYQRLPLSYASAAKKNLKLPTCAPINPPIRNSPSRDGNGYDFQGCSENSSTVPISSPGFRATPPPSTTKSFTTTSSTATAMQIRDADSLSMSTSIHDLLNSTSSQTLSVEAPAFVPMTSSSAQKTQAHSEMCDSVAARAPTGPLGLFSPPLYLPPPPVPLCFSMGRLLPHIFGPTGYFPSPICFAYPLLPDFYPLLCFPVL